MNDGMVDELDLLLNQFWILKQDNEKNFYAVRKKLKELREFSNMKLGCDIISNNKLIKLEKIPIQGLDTFQIEEFDHPLDYVLFTTILLYLEEKGIQEQFILSNLTEYITNFLSTIEGKLKPDWLKYKDRKSLQDVTEYCIKLGLIKEIDHTNESYADNIEAEALYENTGVSHYVIRQFKFDVLSCNTAEDFLELEKLELDPINYKRYQTYRGLMFYPNVVLDEMDKDTATYMKNMRGRIAEDIEKYMDGDLILSKNMYAVSVSPSQGKDVFPNYRKGLSDLALLVNSYLEEFEDFIKDDKLLLTKEETEKLFRRILEENKDYFSKEYREGKFEYFMESVTSYMQAYRLLKIDSEGNFLFYPICFLMSGYYKKEEKQKEVELFEMLSLDLEDDNGTL